MRPLQFLTLSFLAVTAIEGQAVITTLAGGIFRGYTGDNGPATQAELSNAKVAVTDASGNIYFADSANHVIRMVNISGIITTIAGNNTDGTSGDGGPATSASLGIVNQLSLSPELLCFGDAEAAKIRCINLSSSTITGFGTGNPVSAGDGGTVGNASFHYPSGVIFVPRTVQNGVAYDLYLSDFVDNLIRRVAGDTGIVTTIAGTGLSGPLGDGGPATSATLQSPQSLGYFNGSLYVADQGHARVRQINLSTGIINTVAGNGMPYFAGDGGPATSAELTAVSVAFDAIGQMYIGGAEVVRKVDLSGIITTYAGTGTSSGDGPDNVPPSQTVLSAPSGVYWNSLANQILISDDTRIRQVTYQGTTTSIAANPTSVAQGGQVTLTATVSNTAATGMVNFQVNGAFVGSAPLSAGQAVFTWTASGSNPTAGAIYTGDATYAPSASGLVGISITKPSTTTVVTANPNPVTQGQNVTLTATVTPSTATGQVGFYGAGGFLGNGTLANGTATFVIPSGNAGTITVYAIYGGDNNNANSTSPNLTITVLASTSVAISSAPNPSQLGGLVIFTANITPSSATGTVQFLDGAAVLGTGNVGGGSASFTTTSLTQGAHSITAVYSGDANDATATSGILSQVVKGLPSVTVVSTANPSTFGQLVTFSANVLGGATGTVTFTDGGTSIGTGTLNSGTATFSTTSLAVGTHSIVAVYGGDANNLSASSVTFTQTVSQITTTITVTSSENPSNNGDNVRFTAIVTPATATGGVQFLDGTTIISGTGSLNGGSTVFGTPALTPGKHVITAVYLGDTNDAGSTSPAITQSVLNPTTVSLSATQNPSQVGGPVTFVAVMSPSASTGTVQFLDGATTLGTGTISGGSASFTTTSLTQGTHSITAVYSGDASDAASTSAPWSQTVKAVTTAAIASSLNPAIVGQAVTFTVTLNAAATGTAVFQDGSTVLGTGTVSSGVAALTTTTLAQGTHSITVSYSGDANYVSATSAPLTETVNAKTTTTTALVPLAGSPNPSNPGTLVGFTATVSPSTATGAVQFLDGTTVLATLPISGGSVSFNFQLATSGQHLITAVYSGDSSDLGSTSAAYTQTVRNATTVSLSSSPNPSLVGGAVTFVAVVSPSTATGTVQFQDGSNALGAANLSGGMATFSMATLAQGTHTITAVYGGDTNDAVATSNAISQVVNAKTASSTVVSSSVNPSTVGQSVRFTATVSPTSATGTIQFLDGSTVIGTSTLASGSASFSTTALAQGAHSITASYSGDAADNASISSALTQTVNVAAPTAPSNLTATASGSSQINLVWTASSTSGVAYDVYQSTSSGFTPSASNRIANGVTATSYSATGLSGSTTYYYRVSAVNTGGESAPTNQASAATGQFSCHVSYNVTSQWNGGFGATYSIQNKSKDPIGSWTLTFAWPGNQEVTQAWNANYSQSGANVTFTNESYNGTIAAGATLSGMGFNGSFSGNNKAPTAFYVNGTRCQ